MRYEWIIGRLPSNDIVVDLEGISARHCAVSSDGTFFWMQDLDSTNGTYINGRRVKQRSTFTDRDSIRLGLDYAFDQSRLTEGNAALIFSIGGGSGCDVIFDLPMVSAIHAELIFRSGKIYISDKDSTNGTYISNYSNRVSISKLDEDDRVMFGSHEVEAKFLINKCNTIASELNIGKSSQNDGIKTIENALARDLGGTSSSVEIGSAARMIVIGRDASCDIVIHDSLVSGRHVSVARTPGGFVIRDLNSTNGTFIKGKRIDSPVKLSATDHICVGRQQLTISDLFDSDGDNAVTNGMKLIARNVKVDVADKRLLSEVSLALHPGELVGLMGPSGAGKSTLMMALCGFTRPTSGNVSLGGLDLHENFRLFSGTIGYVPQDDIVHPELTVFEALLYSAKLRLPGNYPQKEIENRVTTVLEELELIATSSVRIGDATHRGISGGQRKRVNIAMELLTDPFALFLDEPTSGLSSEDALSVLKLLKKLAATGRIVLLTIHQPSQEAYSLLNNLAIVAKDPDSSEAGQLVYFGPAHNEAFAFFRGEGFAPELSSPEIILRQLKKRSVDDWRKKYERSQIYGKFVKDRLGAELASVQHHRADKSQKPSVFRQISTLTRRTFVRKLRDRWNTAILLLQAIVIGLLISLVFGEKTDNTTDLDWFEQSQSVATAIFLAALSSIWFGCSNSVREIVSEWAVYQRERMVNLSIRNYTVSKAVILGVLSAIQCCVLLSLIKCFCHFEANLVLSFCCLWVASNTGTGIGLLISATARTSEVAVGLLPLVIIPMVILGGILLPLSEMSSLTRTLTYFTPSRWAFESALLLEAAKRSKNLVPIEGMVFQTREVDIAEGIFPTDSYRVGILGATLILVLFTIVLYGLLLGTLKLRDRF